MLPQLVKRYRVVTFDARGHGLSGKPSGGYGFDMVATDALAVARTARMRRPILVGHSWGAMVALELAAKRPKAIAGAVLVDGGLAGPRRFFPDWASARRALAPPKLAGMHVDEFRKMIRMFMDEIVEVTPEIEDIVLAVMQVGRDGRIRPNLSHARHFKILRAIWEQDTLPLYARLGVPTLAIAVRSSEGDDWSSAKAGAMAEARTASKGRPVRFAWMEGIHDLPLQQPAALARRIDRFAREALG